MSRPKDIPQDVRIEAADLWARIVAEEADDSDIARAILAERERCAKVAEDQFTKESVQKNAKGEPYDSGKIAIYASQRIAFVIRGEPTT
jgi:hypothetical protein